MRSQGQLLTDTGPLVALINRNDPHHARCKAAVREWPAMPLLTTWPCWTEAMYLSSGGWLGTGKCAVADVAGRNRSESTRVTGKRPALDKILFL